MVSNKIRSFLMVLVAASLSAQKVGVAIKPVWAPILDPETRNANHTQNGQYVFYDPEIDDYVLKYVSRSAEQGLQVRLVRLGFTNQAHVLSRTSISIREDKLFSYQWQFTNSAASSSPLRSFNFALPKSDSRLACTTNDRAFVFIQQPHHPTGARQIEPADPRPSVALGDSRYMSVSISVDNYIKPGSASGEMSCTSNYLPGWVSVYMSAGSQSQVPDDVPQEALDQLGKMLKPEHYMSSAIVFGPKYPPNAPIEIIALDMKTGLLAMKARGLVDGESGFVKEVERQLDSIAESPNAALRFELKPGNHSETEWHTALKLALPKYFQ